ncbi:peptidase [Comamonas serinivorans]|uniref:Peptidase n=1 Tax=Comamonas serinivorans TaxID=1082851 RepID=A0A1Y0EQQ6_9BURK|nr:DUF1415 domain-containing protein [Comamonas serinivorans]ARU05994.1 peptidase [Comamonas serinivorans]
MNEHDEVIADTRRWVERAVIGLNLCPFAKAVQHKGQVHYAVSSAEDVPGLLKDLAVQLQALIDQDPEDRDTTLLMVPHGFDDFLVFNDFLDLADELLVEMALEGEVQVASFHPRFQFEGTAASDIGNATNRSPYPTLHLLREASIDRAVEAFPEAEAIFEANIATLTELGAAGWQALQVGPGDAAKAAGEATPATRQDAS